MICPNCGTEIVDDAKRCPMCGARVNGSGADNGGMQVQQAAKLATNTGILLGAKARAARMNQAVDPDEILTTSAYNGVIGLVLLWGLLVNYLLCSFAADFVREMNPIVLLVGYVALAFAGTLIAAKSQKPAISFLGYNMVVVPFGLVITLIVDAYTKVNPSVVTYAFLYTLLISVGMMALVMIRPQLFEKLHGVLLGALAGVVLCEAVLLIFHVNQSITDWAVAAIFSLYIGYDIYRSQQFPKTMDNAVDSALDIYMDIANLFIRILSILGRRDD